MLFWLRVLLKTSNYYWNYPTTGASNLFGQIFISVTEKWFADRTFRNQNK
jgi:hypothetical protein